MSNRLQTATDWLEKLVGFDTRNGTGDELACVQFLSQHLGAFKPDGLVTETVKRARGKSDSGYVLARWGIPKILLNVHIDTVPSGEGWTGDPLVLRREGGTLTGLGTSDIKGAAACIMAVLNDTPPKDVAILFSGDEEQGSEVMPEVIRRGHLDGITQAIVCEPTGCKAGRRHRGMLAMSADFSGRGGHSSLSDITEAPLLNAARLAAKVGEYGADHREFGEDPYKGLCVNIGKIMSDGSYNVIPTTASLQFSMRPPPGDNVNAREADVIGIYKSLFTDGQVDTLVKLNPFATRDVAAFRPYFADTEIVDLPYWTEAAMLNEAGVNVMVYGPGDVEQAHKPNEYVTQAHLSEAMKVYARAVMGTE